jgi:phosphatidylglycerol lysyltransferase
MQRANRVAAPTSGEEVAELDNGAKGAIPAAPLWHYVRPILIAAFLALALWFLHRELAEFNYDDVRAQLTALTTRQWILALALTVASYLVLTLYDWLAVRYLGNALSYARVALTSFLAYVLSHNVGLSILGSSAPRYRLYGGSGVSFSDILKIIAFAGVTLWLGWLTLAGVVLLVEPSMLDGIVASTLARPIGVAFLAAVAAYLIWTTRPHAAVRVRHWRLDLPPTRIAAAQVVVSTLDWLLASSVLYVLLPDGGAVSYAKVVAVFLTAMIAGLVSHVPGGLGIFETVTVKALAPSLPAAAVLGSLIAFRVVYYILPLLVAAVLFAAHELAQRRQHVAALGGMFDRWVSGIVPRVLAVNSFVGGTILLASGATPIMNSRLDWLKAIIPLPLLELSHFAGSLAGLALILLANALYRRLDAAYHLAIFFYGTGIVVSLAKGFDYEEALVLSVMLAALLPCRRRFDRRASLLEEPFSLGWLLAVALVVGASIWLGFFAFKYVDYARELWWQFAFEDDAPRFLRATVGVLGAGLAFGLSRLLRTHRTPAEIADAEAGERVAAIVAASPAAAAHLALLGDKRFLFSDDGTGFIMFGIEGRSWIAMGDPICAEEQRAALIWRFCELCDQHDAWPVFYEAGTANLPTFLDIGLTPLKFGELGRVALATFSLEGSARKPMRYVLSRMEREGGCFEVLPPHDVAAVLPRLKVVSDAWLAEKKTREKRFSLGCFDADYLTRCNVAVVRHQGEIVAFANLWCSGGNEEVAPDLMRYHPDAPDSAMEYLFIQIILWSQQRGYRWFNLGMAPLSGLEDRALAPLWHRLGSLAFRRAGGIYNFRGLRRYKEKFGPEWEPRYLVSPGGLALPRILTNLAALISRGLGGAIRR